MAVEYQFTVTGRKYVLIFLIFFLMLAKSGSEIHIMGYFLPGMVFGLRSTERVANATRPQVIYPTMSRLSRPLRESSKRRTIVTVLRQTTLVGSRARVLGTVLKRPPNPR